MLRAAREGVALSGHLFDLEARLANVALREALQRQREFATLANAMFRLYSWPFVQPMHTLEIQDIGRRSLELALSAQTAFAQALLGGSAARTNPLPAEEEQPDAGRRMQPERRVSAQVINFPERRIGNR